MAGLFRRIARTANFLGLSAVAVTLLVGDVCAFAQTGSTPLTGKVSPQANTATHGSDSKASAQPADPRINTTEIVNRLDQELGVDLQATTGGWQRELDRLEGELGRQPLRYSELNEFRDRLQRLRSQVEETWSRLQPRLTADKAEVNLLGAAPAAGQPPEPEQAALTRAELNYHLGLLSGGAKQLLIRLIFALRTYLTQFRTSVERISLRFCSNLFPVFTLTRPGPTYRNMCRQQPVKSAT